MEKFQDYAYYYNAFYKDKDYQKEARDTERLIKKWGYGETQSLLDLGCGTGKHDVEFMKMGYRVTGIDLSAQMIEIAQRNDSSVEYQVADIRDYTPQKSYDGVISLFHVMSYQNKNKDILAAFRTAAKAVRQGGVFIFDFWYGPGVLSDKPSVRVRTAEDKDYILYRIAEPVMRVEENVVDVNYKVFVMHKKTGHTKMIEETHSMRYFFVPELKVLLQQAGFELMECLDSATQQKTDFNSWTAICVAGKV